MNKKLFIADRIKVGFQNRSDTFTGKLAYVIYYDKKNVLRKEQSWESWRDKKIDPVEFENKPHSGFTLNKDVHRGGGDWFGVGRNHIRPRFDLTKMADLLEVFAFLEQTDIELFGYPPANPAKDCFVLKQLGLLK